MLYNLIKVGEPDYSYTTIQLPIFGQVGTALFIVVVTAIIGLICMETCRRTSPQFFTDKAMRYGPSLTELGHVVPARVERRGADLAVLRGCWLALPAAPLQRPTRDRPDSRLSLL